MNIRVWKSTAYGEVSDVHVLWVYDGGELFAPRMPLDRETQAMLQMLLEDQELSGKFGEIYMTNLARNIKPKKLLLLGLGQKNELTFERIRKLTGKAIKELNKSKAQSAHLSFVGAENSSLPLAELVKVTAETAILANYRFKKYLSQDETSQIERLDIVCGDEQEPEYQVAVAEGILLGQAVTAARDLVNEPANGLTPVKLAEAAQQAGAEYGFEVAVYDERQIEAIGMKAFLEVGKAAINPPRLIVMKYTGNPQKPEEILGFIGKGLTYDSGGLSLKSKDSMVNMKDDMAGAAAVISAMSAIARAKLHTNITAVVAACENMVSATGYRPGDIIGTMAGKSVMIKSTDAEGRLTLADAVYYIVQKECAKRVIDLATLTGAATSALGRLVTAAMANNDAWYQQVEQASQLSGERLCRIPLVEEYKELLKSDVADLINSAGANGPNMILAGLFIGEFIPDTPWVHLDIAGTSWAEKESDYLTPGGTGVGAKTLYYLAKLSDQK
ncbi:probable cytosol aminopeptidase [Candidatus Vecturithrix granuli]|uniref:Probable cytosol aminopeptidase n=1 Tax=Vecturithrix granuli TaxID=1499967 RepID=A0A081C5J0_VECG1|nr:probable cytosol aminopeptidase [Candidatus Vecturithrix granuli]